MLILSVQSHEFQYYVIFIVDCSWLPRLLLGKHEPSSAKPYPQYAKLPRLFVILSRNFLNELLLLYPIIFLSFINIAMSLQCTPCVVPLMQSLRCCSFPPSVPRDQNYSGIQCYTENWNSFERSFRFKRVLTANFLISSTINTDEATDINNKMSVQYRASV